MGTFTWNLGTLGEWVLELLRSAPKPLLWLKTPKHSAVGEKHVHHHSPQKNIPTPHILPTCTPRSPRPPATSAPFDRRWSPRWPWTRWAPPCHVASPTAPCRPPPRRYRERRRWRRRCKWPHCRHPAAGLRTAGPGATGHLENDGKWWWEDGKFGASQVMIPRVCLMWGVCRVCLMQRSAFVILCTMTSPQVPC